jgi:hypothetical protein
MNLPSNINGFKIQFWNKRTWKFKGHLKYESCTQIGCFKHLGKLGTVLVEDSAQMVFAPGRQFSNLV